jgi:hypothetical protein
MRFITFEQFGAWGAIFAHAFTHVDAVRIAIFTQHLLLLLNIGVLLFNGKDHHRTSGSRLHACKYFFHRMNKMSSARYEPELIQSNRRLLRDMPVASTS